MGDIGKITVGIRDIEAGSTLFVFDAPPALDQSRPHCLLDALTDWRRHHSDRRVEYLQILRDKGLVRGLHIFWTLFANSTAIPNFNFHDRNDVTAIMYGHEYLEALMEASAKLMVAVRQPQRSCCRWCMTNSAGWHRRSWRRRNLGRRCRQQR